MNILEGAACESDRRWTVRTVEPNKVKPYEHSLIVAHYLYGISKRKIAKAYKKDEKLIRIEIQLAEGFIDGCLSMLDIRLEME